MKKFWFVQHFVNKKITNYRYGWELLIYNRKKDIPKEWFILNEVYVINWIKAKNKKEAIRKFIEIDKAFWKNNPEAKFYI
jgi:hypothetical protein